MEIDGTTLIITDARERFDTDTLNRPDTNSKNKICQKIKKVMIGKSLSVLQSYDGNPDPFNEYSNLERITVSPENMVFRDIDGVLFTKDGTRLITFPDCHSSEYIIPDSVIHIERSAFDYAKKLETITFGKNVKTIGLAAFFHCVKLKSVCLPAGLISIGPGAFSFCSSLKDLELPASIEEIGHSLFYECSSLQRVSMINDTGQKFRTTEGVVFESTTNTLVRVPPGYPAPVYAIPPDTVIIDDYAFANCNNLEEIIIPASVSIISGTSLTMTTNLQRFTVYKQNRFFCDIDGVLFSKDKKRLIAYPGGRYGSYAVPDFVQELGDFCFFSVIFVKKNLSVTIPNEGSIKKGLSIFNPKTELKEEGEES
jgi:hypothetical protein